MELLDKTHIEDSLKEVIGNRTVETWRTAMLDTVAEFLTNDPARYRGFGLYWWNLKKALLSAGKDEFGFEMDHEVADRAEMGSLDLNIASAVLYESWRVDQGLQSNSVHKVNDGDQSVEYILYDQDMEVVVKYKNYSLKIINTATTGTIQESATTVRKNILDTQSGKRIQKKIKKAYTLQNEYSFQGLSIAVENKRGSTRSGVDKGGHKWSIKMKYDYGYIRSTEATDGECVDCYVNRNGRKSQKVFIIHQHKIEVVKQWKDGICPTCGETTENCPHAYDEDKVMLGFRSKDKAKEAYLENYDSPLFLGPISTYTRKEFKKALENSFGKRLPLNVQESLDLWLGIRTAESFDQLKDLLKTIFK